MFNYARWAQSGEDLKGLRLITRFTQRQLAERMGVAPSRVAAIEAARKVTRQGSLRYTSALLALQTKDNLYRLQGTYGRRRVAYRVTEHEMWDLRRRAEDNLENRNWQRWRHELTEQRAHVRSEQRPLPHTSGPTSWPEAQEAWVSRRVYHARKAKARERELKDEASRVEQEVQRERRERIERDVFGVFADDCLRRTPEARTKEDELVDAFEAWARTVSDLLPDPRQLVRYLPAALRTYGLRRDLLASGWVWTGVEVAYQGIRDHSLSTEDRQR
jgi:transcriptional regulator with XRE-family HTH domain